MLNITKKNPTNKNTHTLISCSDLHCKNTGKKREKDLLHQ